MQEDKPVQEEATTQAQANLQKELPPIKEENTNSSSQSSPTLPSNTPLSGQHPPNVEETLPSLSKKKDLRKYNTIYLTGFNAFDTYKFNPTQLAVNIIRAKNLPGVSCQVVDCSIGQVDAYIKRTKQRLHQFQKKDERILHLHLGVYDKAYQLERQAKNWKDFAIPDNAMNFPQRMKIFEGGPNLLKTNVDIELLREESDHLFDMRISSDAGQFICNYIYYCSLYEIGRNFLGNDSLFVHFPFRNHEDKHLEDRDVKCIEDLIKNLQRPQGNLRQEEEEKQQIVEKDVITQTEEMIERIVFIQKSAIIRQEVTPVIQRSVLQPRVIETTIKQPIQNQVIVETSKEQGHGHLNQQKGHIRYAVPSQQIITTGSGGGPQKKEAAVDQRLFQYDHIFLTGFDTFRGVTFNPTEDIVKRISEKRLPRVTCEVVGCSMRKANAYVQKMKALTEEHKEKTVLHLHLGVGGSHYDLERYSRNETRFGGFPDNDGKVLNSGVIVEGGQPQIQTKLKIQDLFTSLRERMSGSLPLAVQVKISKNAGGFICNYIYYKSCLQLQQTSPINHHSLFVHVPDRPRREHGLAEMDLKCVENLLDILLKRNNLRTE